MWFRRLFIMIVAGASAGCSTLMGPAGIQDTSRASEPPAPWESAVLFQFRDSLSDPDAPYAARVELRSERESRLVTGSDVYVTEANLLRTPWYRLRIPDGEQHARTMVRVALSYADGSQTVAEYPITISRDEFYYVSFGIATRTPAASHTPDVVRGMRSYPVPPQAIRQASDSLWIGYYTRGRYCFTCPG